MSDWNIKKGNELVFEQCMIFDWYMSWYKAFLVYRQYTCIKINGANGIEK